MTSKILKKVVCFMVLCTLMLNGLSITAKAGETTKTVTYEQTYTFLINPSQFSNYMNSPAAYVPSTYFYNDGTYKGTLSLTYAACGAPTAVGSYLEVKIFTKYTGTVTAPDTTKTVTQSVTYTFTIYPSQLSNYMNSPASYVPSTYNYNDGTYSGTLYLTYAACGAPTPVGNFLEVKIFTQYSGTVVHK